MADAYLGLAEAYPCLSISIPLAETRYAESFADNQVSNNITTYAMRVGSVEGMRRAALFTAELRSRAVADSAMSAEARRRKPGRIASRSSHSNRMPNNAP